MSHKVSRNNIKSFFAWLLKVNLGNGKKENQK